ncbi:MAG: DUF4340 domain-containing protein [Clostridia bacterium]|nr:DUF4340 domain-containing protein [Clostridia bacterium]
MKRSVKSLLLILVLVLLGGGYYAIAQMNSTSTEAVTETAGEFPLMAADAAVTSLSWAQEETAFAFEKTDDVWRRTGDASFPVNQTALEALVADLKETQASRKLENVSALADYGLDTPAFTFTAQVNGADVTYKLGDATPFSDGYYFTWDDAQVYILNSSPESLFPGAETELVQMEPMPAFDAYTRLTVGNTQSISLDQSYDGTKWHRTDAPQETGDTEKLSGLISTLQSLAWDSLVTWQGADLAQYGLADTSAKQVTVYNGEEAVYTLLLGAAEVASGDVYARLPGSDMVYLLAADTIADVYAATDDGVRSMALPIPSYGEMTALSYDLGKGPVTLEKDETSQDTTLEILHETIAALTGSGVAAEGTTGEILLTLTLTDEQGAVKSLVFQSHNVDHYLVQTDAVRPLLVDAGAVDKLIRQLKNL